MIAEYAPVKHRNIAISMMQIAYPIGAVVSGFVVAWALPIWGWRAIFLIGGLTTLVLIPLVIVALPESVHFLVDRRPPDALGRLNRILARMRQPRLAELPPLPRGTPERTGMQDLLSSEYRRTSLLLLSAFFMCMLTLYFVLSWTPKVITDSGMDPRLGVYGGTVVNAGGIIGTLLMGYLSGFYGLRRVVVSIYLLQALLMMTFAYVIGSAAFLVLLVTALLGACAHGGMIGLYASSAWLYPTRLRSTGLGWAIGLGRTGAILGPYIAGLLMSLGWSREAYFMVMATPLLFAALAIAMIRSPLLGAQRRSKQPAT